MKLGSKARYAVMALIDLKQQKDDEAISLSCIADRQNLSLSYLEQLFLKLRKKGIVKSHRGSMGGYVLARSARDISIFEIIEAVDDPFKATRCQGPVDGCRPGGERCSSHDLWAQFSFVVATFLKGVSLFDATVGIFEIDLCFSRNIPVHSDEVQSLCG